MLKLKSGYEKFEIPKGFLEKGLWDYGFTIKDP
jgi:hypothetical protein